MNKISTYLVSGFLKTIFNFLLAEESFIFELKKHEINEDHKLDSFLEVGFSSGINNSVINKFFNFKHIVGLDYFASSINTESTSSIIAKTCSLWT